MTRKLTIVGPLEGTGTTEKTRRRRTTLGKGERREREPQASQARPWPHMALRGCPSLPSTVAASAGSNRPIKNARAYLGVPSAPQFTHVSSRALQPAWACVAPGSFIPCRKPCYLDLASPSPPPGGPAGPHRAQHSLHHKGMDWTRGKTEDGPFPPSTRISPLHPAQRCLSSATWGQPQSLLGPEAGPSRLGRGRPPRGCTSHMG